MTPGYDEACKSPGKGPGSPPPSEASGPGSAVTRTTDDSDSFSRARCYGSSHRRASGCDVPRPNALSSYGCCSGFFGPVGKRNKESVAAARSANTKLNFHRFNFKMIGVYFCFKILRVPEWQQDTVTEPWSPGCVPAAG